MQTIIQHILPAKLLHIFTFYAILFVYHTCQKKKEWAVTCEATSYQI